jgi:hypothetical protein
MTITASKLRNRSRRIDRINATVEGVLAAMKAGQCLHCEFGPRRIKLEIVERPLRGGCRRASHHR